MNPEIFAYSDHNIEELWRSLANKSSFIIQCEQADIVAALTDLENIGACALDCTPYRERFFHIHGYKGKRGPCYDTGRRAQLLLNDFAACDDDRHVLFGDLAVCEKTAAIYQLPVYQDMLSVSAADALLLERYAHDPKEFNCDTLSDDVQRLADCLPQQAVAGAYTEMLYGGPFRMLICPDGAILHRGCVQRVSAVVFADMQKRNMHVYECPQARDAEGIGVYRETTYFQEQFAARGVACLCEPSIEITALADMPPSADKITQQQNFTELNRISPAFLSRVRSMIERQDPYMLISGSDPGDPLGCCPSEDVAQAKKLCSAGIFESQQQNSAGESCPITLFTFLGESQAGINQEFRQRILESLPAQHLPAWKRLLRAALLIFVVYALAIAVIRMQRDYQQIGDIVLTQQLQQQLHIPKDNCTIIAVFHKHKRCAFCLNMEKHARHFVAQSKDRSVYVRTIDIDVPASRHLAERLDLFTSTVVIFRIENGEIVNSSIVEELWSLTVDESSADAFFDQLGLQLNALNQALP